MTDSTTATAATATAKTVQDDMPSRRIFTDTTSAAAYLNMAANTYSDFASIPLAAQGIDENGDFDPAVYTDQMVPMVATLTKAKAGMKAIVIVPVPTLDYLLSDAPGREWVEKIIQKELNHVAVRQLRVAEDVSTVADQMPTTRDAYISSSRDGGAGIMESFNELYKQINNTMSKIPTWARAKLTKGELKKVFESKGYADEFFTALENHPKMGSLFVVALNMASNAATKKGLDPTIFDRWLATRDAKVFVPGTTEEDEDFDLESLTDSMLAAPAEEPAKEGDAAAPVDPAQAPAVDAPAGEPATA